MKRAAVLVFQTNPVGVGLFLGRSCTYLISWENNIHLMSDPEGNSFVFPRVTLGKQN